MATPEAKVKDKVRSILKQNAAYWHCPVQNGMGAPSLDFICCLNGQYFAVETKAPGKKPTPRQEHTMRQIASAGGKCFVIDGDEDDLRDFDNWLKEIA